MTRTPNKIKNHKYNIITFLPKVLFNQFSLFGNQFYLLLIISQFFNPFKVGFLFSYVTPLVFVLTVTLFKEGYDDIYRYKQDRKTNSEEYILLENINEKYEKRNIRSEDIKVGDLIELHRNQRVPADMIALKSYNKEEMFSTSGNLFIRTDQLDGETDWKLRKTPNLTQNLNSLDELIKCDGYIHFDPPGKMIYEFKGVLFLNYGVKSPNSNRGKGFSKFKSERRQ